MSLPDDFLDRSLPEPETADEHRHDPKREQVSLDLAGLPEDIAADQKHRGPVGLGNNEPLYRVAGVRRQADSQKLDENEGREHLPDRRRGAQDVPEVSPEDG